jgi:protein phosphatase-4 regulatory subunit 3
MQRVKVYEMSSDGNWNDKGTGYVSLMSQEKDETETKMAIVVKGEVDNEILLHSTIQLQEYTRQQDTLILWSDGSLDLALSFQEQKGCDDLWDSIIELQQRMANRISDSLDPPPPTHIPLPTIQNLPELEKLFLVSCRSQEKREWLLSFLLDTGFCDSLFSLLEELEKDSCLSELYRMSCIVRCILFLNNHELYLKLLEEDLFVKMLGILEYDRDYPSIQGTFRSMYSQAKHKMFFDIQDQEMVTKIRHIYKASFIKDVALARNLEDSTFSCLSQLISTFQSDVLVYIQNNNELLDSIVQSENASESWSFLQELFTMIRGFSKECRHVLVHKLLDRGLLGRVEQGLREPEITNRLYACSVLSHVLEYSAIPIRQHCIRESSFLDSMVDRFTLESDEGVLYQLVDCLKMMLDIQEKQDLESFLETFYPTVCERILIPLEKPVRKKRDASVCLVLLDLVVYLITHHAHAKPFFASAEWMGRFQRLLSSSPLFLRLGKRY